MRLNLIATIQSCLLCVAILSLLSACDTDYDLSREFDTTVNVGGHLTVPVGHTVKIPLSRLISEYNNLKTDATGLYVVHSNGEFASSAIKIAPVSMRNLYADFGTYTLSGLPQMPLFNSTIDVDIPFEIVANYNDLSIDLPKEIDEVYFIKFNDGELPITFDVNVPRFPVGVDKIEFRDINIEFPKMMMTDTGDNEGRLGHCVVSAQQPKSSLLARLVSAHFSAEDQAKYIVGERGAKRFVMNDEQIRFTAVARVSVNLAMLTESSMEIEIKYLIPDNACISEVAGKFYPDVKLDTRVNLLSIPAYLRGEHNIYDPTDIAVNIIIDNPFNATVSSRLIFSPYKVVEDGKRIKDGDDVVVDLSGLNAVDKSAVSNILISKLPSDQSQMAGIKNIVCPELAQLLSTLPDELHVHTEDLVAQSERNASDGIALDKDYLVNGSYNFEVPFRFNNIVLEYVDVVEDLAKDLKDVADLTDCIVLSADAVSTIPLELSFNVDFLDAAGKHLDGIVSDINNIVVLPSVDGKTERVTHFQITLREKNGSSDLERLDKISYSLKAEAKSDRSAPIEIHDNQYIVFRNGVASIPHGITTTL